MYAKTLALFSVMAATGLAAPAPMSPRNDVQYQATWYDVGANACEGTNDNPSDYLVAMNVAQFDGSCAKWVAITNTENGKTATAQVVDECPSCAYGSLDMSKTLFQALASGGLDQGVFQISWSYTDGSGSGSGSGSASSAAADSSATDAAAAVDSSTETAAAAAETPAGSSSSSSSNSNSNSGHHGHHHGWN